MQDLYTKKTSRHFWNRPAQCIPRHTTHSTQSQWKHQEAHGALTLWPFHPNSALNKSNSQRYWDIRLNRDHPHWVLRQKPYHQSTLGMIREYSGVSRTQRTSGSTSDKSGVVLLGRATLFGAAFFLVLGTEPGALMLISKHTITELYPKSPPWCLLETL